VRERLLRALAHPNIASKHWIIRQYDHEVQGGSVIKPLTGPLQVGPSDAAVLRPKLDSYRGVALGCGLAPHIKDPYQMAIAAIDEAIRNVVAVGADPSRTAILDNFCWPSVDDERTMGDLVRACEACRDAARAYGIPFISGKDSLNNQFIIKGTGQVIRIPNTLLISAIGIVEDVRKCVTMDLKDGREGRLALISPPSPPTPLSPSPGTPAEGRGEGAGRLAQLAAVHRALAAAIARGMVLSCHDVSDGGWLTAAAEMCIGSGLGLALEGGDPADMFDESPGRYLVEVHALGLESFQALLASAGASMRVLGSVNAAPILQVGRLMPDRSTRYDLHVSVDDLTRAWRGTLDW
jgi:phosphoribosylformylglycinamidine synthase